MAQPPPKIKPKTGTGHIIIMLGGGGKMPRTPKQAPEPAPKKPFKQKSSRPKDW